jgi:hypothetical protein
MIIMELWNNFGIYNYLFQNSEEYKNNILENGF